MLKHKDGKQYWVLKGLVTNEKAWTGTAEEQKAEIESQAEQLYQFVYRQIPATVAKRLKEKLNNI